MDLTKRFGTDKNLEQTGVWVELGEGASVKVARIGNEEYKKCFRRLTKPYRARPDSIPDDIADKILIQAMAETILLDWNGIEKDGKPLPYSVENATSLLRDLPDFRNTIGYLANEMETFRVAETKELEKNLPTSSAGK